MDERPVEDALRSAAAAAWASKLELGAGRFDLRELGRIAPEVRVTELDDPAE